MAASRNVYTSLTSPFGRSVRICLQERRIEHTIVESKREERQTAEHLARHPFAKVPVLEHDGFIIYETRAIIRYVADVFPGDALVASGPQEAARMNPYMAVDRRPLSFFRPRCDLVFGSGIFS